MIAQPSWLGTEEVLDRYGGSRASFEQVQEAYLKRNVNILPDLHHGLYLGSNDFAQECIKRIEQKDYRETPQFRSLARERDIRVGTVKILRQLGEKDAESLLGVRRVRSLNRDLCIYILYQRGVYWNEEIGRAFDIGYTAVTAAVNRARRSFKDDKHVELTVEKILSDK